MFFAQRWVGESWAVQQSALGRRLLERGCQWCPDLGRSRLSYYGTLWMLRNWNKQLNLEVYPFLGRGCQWCPDLGRSRLAYHGTLWVLRNKKLNSCVWKFNHFSCVSWGLAGQLRGQVLVYHGDLWIWKKSLTSQIIPRVQSPLESAELWS